MRKLLLTGVALGLVAFASSASALSSDGERVLACLRATGGNVFLCGGVEAGNELLKCFRGEDCLGENGEIMKIFRGFQEGGILGGRCSFFRNPLGNGC